MPYLPQTKSDTEKMLKEIGVSSVKELVSNLPKEHLFPKLDLPKPASEIEILAELNELAKKNKTSDDLAIFLGAGAYNHFVPSALPALYSRGEFLTAYTPYQPEVSQGTLQAIFEYQTMAGRLLAMPVVNASHYDGATSMAEAAIMSISLSNQKRKKVVVAPSVHPQYRQTMRTYIPRKDVVITGDENPAAGMDDLLKLVDKNTACLIIQNPTFFGEIIDVEGLADKVHAAGALLVVVATPLMSLGLLTPPGEYGADIVVAEGQPLGAGLNYGGPYLGVFATREEFIRKMPGRLIGQTVDTEGNRGYVLTLSTREQHIRREKATSNICSNQGLVALIASMYMSYMGKQGMREVAEQCYHKAHYLASQIAKNTKFKVLTNGEFFNEFVVECPQSVDAINDALLKKGILGGYDLEKDYSNRKNQMLLCVTEMNSRAQIDQLVEALKEIGE